MLRLPDSWVWDFWLAEHDGSYHVFFLFASRSLHDPGRRHLRAGVGHAISTDLRSWERVADALVHGDAPSFDQSATWTGSVVRGADDRWYMFYTGTTDTGEILVQQVGLAVSDDLLSWQKHTGNPVVTADPRWYETADFAGERAVPWRDEHWRDPFVFADPDGDGWHMFVTGRANTGPLGERGVVAHARSKDLLTWDVQPPLSEPGVGFGQLEVFQVAEVDGRWVLIFNCFASESPRAKADGVTGGIWAANAASALGPFDLANAVLLSDERLYVGKLVQDPTGNWVLLAFENLNGPDGEFVGALTDPLPAGWDGDTFTVQLPG